ncbi:MAG: serine/threonine-protein kinase [Chloroflexota bacterium]
MDIEKIGRYKVLAELGRGGMATVFRAADPNFEREVAIKVLPKVFLHDEQFRVRFEREAKVVAALEHSSIVPVYDFGEQDGQPYIVMRLMTGGSLEDKLKNGRLSIDEAAKIIKSVGTALDAAHAKNIIHRDLKPANILFDQYNNAYLSDFGIARLSEGSQNLTGENIIGTPAYMSPEQIQGDHILDGRSDLYSLGIIFFQMLSGDAPYQATTPAKVMMMHVLEPVPNLLEVRPNLSQAIEVWLEKSLKKDPEDRYKTADEMAEALEAAMRDEAQPTVQMPAADPTVVSDRSQLQTMVGKVEPVKPAAPPQMPATKVKRGWLPFAIGGIGVMVVGVIAVIALVFSGTRGEGPLASILGPSDGAAPTTIPVIEVTDTVQAAAAELPTTTQESASPAPTHTQEAVLPPPTEIVPTATAEPEKVVIGGAESIAFLKDNDIWIMNVDGSDLHPLTEDGAEKHNLSYSPDGMLHFISGKCVREIDIESGEFTNIACFETAEYFESFEVSPDGTKAAISLNRELHVIHYDREALLSARSHADLRAMNACEAFGPLQYNTGTIKPTKLAHWSSDGKRLSTIELASVGGIQSEIIHIFVLGNCIPPARRIDGFPAARFQVDNYTKAPYIQTFGHNGDSLYALTSFTRNDGFGLLYFYNNETHKADTKVNAVGATCCYRDPHFSPDGRYLLFAYQAFEPDAETELYLIPYAEIGTGASFDPIPIPEGFFSDRKAKPEPILIPAE